VPFFSQFFSFLASTFAAAIPTSNLLIFRPSFVHTYPAIFQRPGEMLLPPSVSLSLSLTRASGLLLNARDVPLSSKTSPSSSSSSSSSSSRPSSDYPFRAVKILKEKKKKGKEKKSRKVRSRSSRGARDRSFPRCGRERHAAENESRSRVIPLIREKRPGRHAETSVSPLTRSRSAAVSRSVSLRGVIQFRDIALRNACENRRERTKNDVQIYIYIKRIFYIYVRMRTRAAMQCTCTYRNAASYICVY